MNKTIIATVIILLSLSTFSLAREKQKKFDWNKYRVAKAALIEQETISFYSTNQNRIDFSFNDDANLIIKIDTVEYELTYEQTNAVIQYINYMSEDRPITKEKQKNILDFIFKNSRKVDKSYK